MGGCCGQKKCGNRIYFPEGGAQQGHCDMKDKTVSASDDGCPFHRPVGGGCGG